MCKLKIGKQANVIIQAVLFFWIFKMQIYNPTTIGSSMQIDFKRT